MEGFNLKILKIFDMDVIICGYTVTIARVTSTHVVVALENSHLYIVILCERNITMLLRHQNDLPQNGLSSYK